MTRVHHDLRAVLGHLLDVLREQGAIAEPRKPTGYIAEELRRYDEHMRDAQGLTAGTRRARLRTVRRLLLQKFAGRWCARSLYWVDNARPSASCLRWSSRPIVLRLRPNGRAIFAWLNPCVRYPESIYLSSEVSW